MKNKNRKTVFTVLVLFFTGIIIASLLMLDESAPSPLLIIFGTVLWPAALLSLMVFTGFFVACVAGTAIFDIYAAFTDDLSDGHRRHLDSCLNHLKGNLLAELFVTGSSSCQIYNAEDDSDDDYSRVNFSRADLMRHLKNGRKKLNDNLSEDMRTAVLQAILDEQKAFKSPKP